eukprot:gene909-13516_t
MALCVDTPATRAAEKCFHITSLPGEGGACLTKAEVFEVFHFSPYVGHGDDGDDTWSAQTCDALFSSIAGYNGRAISFTDLCTSHVGGIMLERAQQFILREVDLGGGDDTPGA